MFCPLDSAYVLISWHTHIHIQVYTQFVWKYLCSNDWCYHWLTHTYARSVASSSKQYNNWSTNGIGNYEWKYFIHYNSIKYIINAVCAVNVSGLMGRWAHIEHYYTNETFTPYVWVSIHDARGMILAHSVWVRAKFLSLFYITCY